MPAGGINSAYRDTGLQRKLFLERYTPQKTGGGPFNDVRWYQGVRYVRTSAAGMVAIPGSSTHETGLALDMATGSAAHAWMLKHAAAHGWKRTIPAEPWHWQYQKTYDKHLSKNGVFDVAKLPRIRPGARGKHVGIMQGALIASGYNVGKSGVDSVYGKDTEKAVVSYQQKNPSTGTGGKPDKVCGPKMWNKLLG